ncbi:MAG: phosphoenolpyruvate--protein phosphotransferase [Candidatus Muproteobacteria bacterium RIFCSPLOWO2_01_FULL_60_18]|uniref:Phosphoenolpyruvate-protein phosphotransferase n=1 Tax=Candidatus Muproteobacteria bacterium RIFCSPLOWO2_01_FULL_60_18 TaxID=1817768 RepID=A0A1F6TWP0_9PROT|nr:MAG: phosphoenolpyruvate--protein phosphotransferase [Candidatus Muproteobacteria bacterium RIFCSPLOWO2_01_FULL_60_18]
MMLALHGTGVSDGVAIGKAFVLQRELPEIPEYAIPREYIEEEVARFQRAVEASRRQLMAIREHIPANAPPEATSFLDAHMLMLDDKMISMAPIEAIRSRQYNAEWALKTQSEILSAIFEQMDDHYLRNKKTDVNQVVNRIQRNLLQQNYDEHEKIAEGEIVVADDLTPADTVMLKHNRVRAFVTSLGGPISHTAILARSLGIPAIVAAHSATRYVSPGEELIVDGKRGMLIIAPDRPIMDEYRRRQKDIARRKRELNRLKTSRAITRDRRRIALLANIELPADVRAAVQAGAEGIGLYRTEFLFMNRPAPPNEEEQFRAYTKVIKSLPGKPVTIRTVDLGADKQVDGGRAGATITVNPALGLRAVRLCLHDTSLFRPQLRAILRASAFGKVRMMIPMLSGQEELFQVLDLIEETKSDLKRERIKFNPKIPVGGMIEVPAAAISADLFAPHLDFFSIGTNDLIQYTLAIDRVDDAVNYLYDPLHPSVLRLISITIKAGKQARIPVAMCGEMAGDPRYTRLLLGLGLTEFSMHPATLLEVKKIVREADVGQFTRFARDLLKLRDPREVHARVEKQNRH